MDLHPEAGLNPIEIFEHGIGNNARVLGADQKASAAKK